MAENSKIYLSIVSDDYGMCQAVNDGIAQGFEKGILTDTNLMAPCPVFPEAAQWAKSHKIPIGMHATFTAEWDFLRWKPLTGMKSMVLPDGTLHPTVEEAWKNADIQEAEKEFEAQWKAIESYGLKITYISEHMSFDSNGKMANLFIQKVKEKKVPYLSYTLDLKKHPISHTAFDTSFFTGYSTDLKTMKEKLKGWIESMKPGYHLWNCHCAVDHPSLDQLCKPGHVGFHWARTYRMIDQSLILDPEVRGWIEKRGIQRIPVSQCPVVGS